MTLELKENIERQLENAKASDDPKQIHEAMCMATIALMDCQMKTASRVKDERQDMYELKREIAAKFAEVKQDNADFQNDIDAKFDTIKDEIKSLKDKGTGAMAVIKALFKIAALGGGSVGVAGIAKAFGII